MDWMISIPDNGWKPSIAAIFRSPQGRDLANGNSCFFPDGECFLKISWKLNKTIRHHRKKCSRLTCRQTWSVYRACQLSKIKSHILYIYWINLAQDHNIKWAMMFMSPDFIVLAKNGCHDTYSSLFKYCKVIHTSDPFRTIFTLNYDIYYYIYC